MTQIKLRRDTAANWASANSVLAQGEPAIDITNLGIKIGDGTTAWPDLKFLIGGQPDPSITYEGTVIGLPALWRYTTSGPILQYSSNNTFLNTGGNYLWLDQYFDNDSADYSGISEIHFNNIGGINDYFQYYKKAEDALTTIDLGKIAYIGGWFNIGNFSNTLTTVSANNLIEVRDNFEINNMHTDNGVELVFPALEKTDNFYIDWNWNNMVNTPSPSFPALKTINSAYIYYNKYVSWSNFPNLNSVGWEISFYQNTNDDYINYAGPGFPALQIVPGYINYYENSYMTSIPEFTALYSVGNAITIRDNPNLESFPSFPALDHIGNNFNCYNNTSMTGIDGADGFLPSIKQIGGQVNFDNCALTEASVDAILARLVSLDGTNGTTLFTNAVYLGGGSNSIPSAQGLADITTLENRGCYVAYNS